MVDLTWRERLGDVESVAVRELLFAARRSEGRPEVTLDGPLPREFTGGRHLLAFGADADLTGYAHLDPDGDALGNQIGELIVHPKHRGHGVGSALAGELLSGDVPMRIWAHGDHPAAAAIAAKHGLRRARELLLMRLDFTANDCPSLPVPRWSAGVRLRTFVPGQDEADVVEVNRRAFDWHPEQGRLTVDELTATEWADWFDPDGFFLAVDTEDRLLGFHWTKVHPADPLADPPSGPVGEVYVVGVAPDAQGGGLGTALTLAGLHHLHRSGLAEVILYVESDNTAAVTVYNKLGFRHANSDVAYQR